MPQTTVMLFRQTDGTIPMLEWLENLERRDPRGHAKCLERILSLENLGNELRRPLADNLGDGIFELRARAGNVQHRILYFFSGRNEAVLSHGVTKERKVDPDDIEKAVKHKKLVAQNKARHTAEWSENDDDEAEDDDNG